MNTIIVTVDLERLKMSRNKIEINELSESTKASLKTRVISAIVGIAIVLPCLMIGDWFFFGVIAFAAAVGTYEIIRCVKPKHSFWITLISAIIILLMTCWPMLRQVFNSALEATGWKLWSSFETLYLSIFVLCFAFMIIFFFVVVDKDTSVGDATFIFTIGLMMAFGFQCLLFTRYYPIVDYYSYNFGWDPAQPLPSVDYFNTYENCTSSLFTIYICLASFMTDVGAYFTGILFGKHKMNERISPKKTWEGFFGGIVLSTVVSVGMLLPMALTKHPLLSILDMAHWYNIVVLAIGIPLFSVLGDFVFSSLKRYYGIKDFGNIIPGHGGILDRVDSLLFAVIFVAVYICMVSGKVMPLL